MERRDNTKMRSLFDKGILRGKKNNKKMKLEIQNLKLFLVQFSRSVV